MTRIWQTDMADHHRLFRLIVHVLGLVVVALSLVFVGVKIYQTRLWNLPGVDAAATIAVILAGSLIYAADALLLSEAWRRLLKWAGHLHPPVIACHVIYARSQIAKYLPGNVFHVANRHLLGRQAGIGHRALAAAALFEVVGLLAAAATVAVAGVAAFEPARDRVPLALLPAALLVLLLAPLVINLMLQRTGLGERWQLPRRSHAAVLRSMLVVLLIYVGFFVVGGLLLVASATAFSPLLPPREALLMVTVFAIAWIAGFITPGAPAGAGVREASLIVALRPLFSDEVSLLIAMTFRVITTLGDVTFFAASFLVRGALIRPGGGASEVGD